MRTDYSRDLGLVKWGSGVSLHGSNLEPLMSWVKSGHRKTFYPCPLYPQKRTSVERIGMSALCQ